MRRARTIVVSLLVIGVLLPVALLAQSRARGTLGGGTSAVVSPYNPKPFQKFVVSPSGPVRFLFSEKGMQFARTSRNSGAQAVLKAMGESPNPSGSNRVFRPPITRGGFPMAATVNSACNAANGSVFNLEPAADAMPQNEESVDFFPGGGGTGVDLIIEGYNDYRELGDFSLTGYSVHRAGTDCSTQFDGGLPEVADPLAPGNYLYGGGDPVVAINAGTGTGAGNVYFADLRWDNYTTGIGVFKTTKANLLNTTTCPNGEHTSAQAMACWPMGIVVNPLPEPDVAYFQDKPHMMVDDRASGTGAGNVYVSATEFDFLDYYSRIWLVSCTSDLKSCSSPTIVSGSDTATQFSHIAVRSDGVVSVTYINVVYNPNTGGDAFDIKYVKCLPANAPITPSCYQPVLVAHETQPLDFGGTLGAEDFRVVTYPKHDYQVESNGTQIYVVWDRCKSLPWMMGTCPDADVVMSASNNSGVTWSAPGPVDTNAQDQFFPWIKTDRYRQIINIVYYSSVSDPWQHRLQVYLRQISPGTGLPNPVGSATLVTTSFDDPAADPVLGGMFYGDYIGVAARGTSSTAATSSAYVGFTWNARQGTYNSQSVPQQDDNISRVDY